MNGNTIDHQSRLMQNPVVILRENEPGGPMIFNPDNSEMRILNETGLRIWQLCRQAVTQEVLLVRLLEEFSHDDGKQVEQDLFSFLQEMVKYGFIGVLC